MFKQRAVLLVTASVLLIIALITSACDSGKMKPNQAPEIFITSYAGTDTVNTTANEVILFQQKIYWNAYDSDGSVKGYAYRVLNSAGIPIVTPGNDTIDTNGQFTPAVLKSIDSKYGWIIHTPSGVTDPNKRTIWTEDVTATINFPANVNGDSSLVVSAFEVVAIDNRGEISSIKRKYFNAQSHKPIVFASTSKGVFEKEEDDGTIVPNEIGQGVKLVFTMNDNDPYVGSTPWYFEYQLVRYPLVNPTDTNVDTLTVNPSYESPWMTTRYEDNVEQKVLTATENPNLESNYKNPVTGEIMTDRQTITILRVRAVDLAGIKSDVRSYRFFVNGSYFPQTLVYHKKCYALGDNHYIERQDPGATEVLPFIKTPTGTKIARPFFLHPVNNVNVTGDTLLTPTEFKLTAMANNTNNNLKVWLRWGYEGEFNDNDPDNTKKSVPRDSLGTDYQTEISYYLIQLDGQRYQFGPLKDDATQASFGNTDPNWLKIPAGHDISQKINISGLEAGVHTLIIKTEDLQGKTDPTPAVFQFEVVAPTPVEARKDILVLTSEANEAVSLLIKDFYLNTLKEIHPEMNVHFAQRLPWVSAISNLNTSMKDYNNNPFAPSFLQQYKYVIFYRDFKPFGFFEVNSDADPYRIFLNINGTLIISGGDNVAFTHKNMLSVEEYLFTTHFGLPSDPENAYTINPTGNYAQKPYIKGINSAMNPPFTNIEVDTTSTALVTIVKQKQGLSTISYFKNVNPNYVMYKTVCKPVDTSNANSPQNDADYAEYNDKAICFVKENGTMAGTKGKGYLFALPISMMDKADAKTLLQKIMP